MTLDTLLDQLNEIVTWSGAAQATALALMAQEQGESVSGHVLDVPYLSQWDAPDADDRPGDCGPACVAMLVHHLTNQRPTVDEAATACGQPTTGSGRWTTSLEQLTDGARSFGVQLHYARPLNVSRLISLVDANRPAIALINYGVLGQHVENQDDFQGGHFVLVVGYDDEHIIIHDPDWGIGGDRRDEGAFRRISRRVYDLAAGTPKKGYFSYGYQGLVLE